MTVGIFTAMWVGFGVVTAIAAAARGRNFLGWLVLGCLFGVFGLLSVLVMRPVAQSSTANTPTGWSTTPDHGTPGGAVASHRNTTISTRGDGYWAMGEYFTTIEAAKAYIDRYA